MARHRPGPRRRARPARCRRASASPSAAAGDRHKRRAARDPRAAPAPMRPWPNSVLVPVGGDRGDAGHFEIERRDGLAVHPHERREQPAHAGRRRAAKCRAPRRARRAPGCRPTGHGVARRRAVEQHRRRPDRRRGRGEGRRGDRVRSGRGPAAARAARRPCRCRGAPRPAPAPPPACPREARRAARRAPPARRGSRSRCRRGEQRRGPGRRPQQVERPGLEVRLHLDDARQRRKPGIGGRPARAREQAIGVRRHRGHLVAGIETGARSAARRAGARRAPASPRGSPRLRAPVWPCSGKRRPVVILRTRPGLRSHRCAAPGRSRR